MSQALIVSNLYRVLYELRESIQKLLLSLNPWEMSTFAQHDQLCRTILTLIYRVSSPFAVGVLATDIILSPRNY